MGPASSNKLEQFRGLPAGLIDEITETLKCHYPRSQGPCPAQGLGLRVLIPCSPREQEASPFLPFYQSCWSSILQRTGHSQTPGQPVASSAPEI